MEPYADGIIYPAAHFNYERVYASSNFKIPKKRYSMEQSMFLLEMPLKNMKLKMEEGLL